MDAMNECPDTSRITAYWKRVKTFERCPANIVNMLAEAAQAVVAAAAAAENKAVPYDTVSGHSTIVHSRQEVIDYV